MGELEQIYFQIIASVGMARSLFIEAIQFAKSYDFDKAYKSIEEGNEHFLEGHKAHAKLIQKEASGQQIEFSMILLHAEDQFMSAETFKILSTEFIDLYKQIEKDKNN